MAVAKASKCAQEHISQLGAIHGGDLRVRAIPSLQLPSCSSQPLARLPPCGPTSTLKVYDLSVVFQIPPVARWLGWRPSFYLKLSSSSSSSSNGGAGGMSVTTEKASLLRFGEV
eukprot:RCo042464